MRDRIIQAAIVNHERTHVIVDANGSLPQMEFDSEHGTHEDTLFHIGRRALTNVAYVSVDHRLARDGATLYQTKPVPAEAEPNEPFTWGACPDGVSLV